MEDDDRKLKKTREMVESTVEMDLQYRDGHALDMEHRSAEELFQFLHWLYFSGGHVLSRLRDVDADDGKGGMHIGNTSDTTL